MTLLIRAGLMLAACFAAGSANAAVNTYYNLTDFNTAAGSPPVSIDFDGLSGNIAGQTIAGVTFTSPNGNTLEVVKAADTVSFDNNPANSLPATSGANVLSPGGVDLVAGPALAEEDSLNLKFASPLSAFGLDVLFQSYDCCTYTSYTIFDTNGATLASDGLPGNGGGGGNPAAALFVGFVSDSANIGSIQFDETDGDANNPDSNIGYDTLRFFRIAAPVPEPATWMTMLAGFGLLGGMLRRHRGTASAIA